MATPKNHSSTDLLSSSTTVSFADVAHQTLIFDRNDPASALILELIDTAWVQRLRQIRQTGNTHLVYMFAEHSRFGHSLGVAYLAITLMNHLSKWQPALIAPWRDAVAAAALLHDLGHTAPGSHLAEQVWYAQSAEQHETVTMRIIREDHQICSILKQRSTELPELVCRILKEDTQTPPWTRAVISGGGWNADRGNWTIVDSAMCSVSYGRYNIFALIDAFRLSENGELVLQENRLDALTHFLVARDSMYRQVYQHRTLQAVDALTKNIVLRLRDLLHANNTPADLTSAPALFADKNVFADDTMLQGLLTEQQFTRLPLEVIFRMTESWWMYHVSRWCDCNDSVLRDLSRRLRDRNLFKTIRLGGDSRTSHTELVDEANAAAAKLGFDSRYYVAVVDSADKHRRKKEVPPFVLLDNGTTRRVTEVEPMISMLFERPEAQRMWLAVPKEIKDALGRTR